MKTRTKIISVSITLLVLLAGLTWWFTPGSDKGEALKQEIRETAHRLKTKSTHYTKALERITQLAEQLAAAETNAAKVLELEKEKAHLEAQVTTLKTRPTRTHLNHIRQQADEEFFDLRRKYHKKMNAFNHLQEENGKMEDEINRL
ncbi:MAG: hypothetical protein GY950_27855, partial [bacterium]|nr:hypothetical protein [bacterium]